MKIGFTIGSDTQRETAEEISREFRKRVPGVHIRAFSTRTFLGLPEFPDEVTRQFFDRVEKPARNQPLRWRSEAYALLQKLHLHSLGRRIRRGPFKVYFPDMDRLLSDGKFDFLFVLNDRNFPSSFLIREFQARGTCVGLVQESIRRDDSSDDRPGLKWNGQGGCDVVYAWGPTSREYYLRAGVRPERIVSIGNPRMDRYLRENGGLPGKAEMRRRLGLPEDGRLVLIATNPVHNMKLRVPLVRAEYEKAIKEAVAWAGESGARAIVKPHLLEKAEFASWGIPEWVGGVPHAVYGKDIGLVQAIRASDAVLVFNSTTALEAALMERPSALLAADRYTHGTDFLETGLSRKVDSADDLKALFRDGFTRSGGKVEEYLSTLGNSAEKIVEDALTRIDAP
jgi:hypothetical protein